MFGTKLLYQLRNPQLPFFTILIECLTQAVSSFLCFHLKQDAIEQRELFAIHTLDFLVQ